MRIILYKGRSSVVINTDLDGFEMILVDHVNGIRLADVAEDTPPYLAKTRWYIEPTATGLRVTEGPDAPLDWTIGEDVDLEANEHLRAFLPHLLGIAGIEHGDS